MTEIVETEKVRNKEMSDSLQGKTAEELKALQQQRTQIESILEDRFPGYAKSVKNNPGLRNRVNVVFGSQLAAGGDFFQLLIHLGMVSFTWREQNGGEYVASFHKPEYCPKYELFGKKVVFMRKSERSELYKSKERWSTVVIEDDGTEDLGDVIATLPGRSGADELAHIFNWEVDDQR